MRIILLIFAMLICAGCQSRPNITEPASRGNDGQPIQNSGATAPVFAEQPAVQQQPDSIPTPVVQPADTVPIPEPETPPPAAQTTPSGVFVDYDVAFASQAPFGVWDDVHGETCEEAAMVMAVYHFRGQSLTAHTMEQALLSLVKWEGDHGYSIDLTTQETVAVLGAYFDYQTTLHTDVSIVAIKAELDQGNLVIIPAAGRELGNPYFTDPGPIYHMLVVRGYDETKKEFITNDPGTRRGEAYRYSYQTLLSAIHDWDHSLGAGGMTDAEMVQGRKVFISIGSE